MVRADPPFREIHDAMKIAWLSACACAALLAVAPAAFAAATRPERLKPVNRHRLLGEGRRKNSAS